MRLENKKWITLQRMAALFVVSGLLGTVTTAQSAGSSADAASANDKLDNCVAHLEPVKLGQKASAVTEIGCYATFAEAMSAASEGKTVLSPNATPNSITESDAALSANHIIIGIDYDGRNFSGASLTWTVSNPNGCFGGASFVANMPAFFNNRLTSTRSFSGCRRNISYSGFFQTGYFQVCPFNCTFIGSFLNNQTSSKRLTR